MPEEPPGLHLVEYCPLHLAQWPWGQQGEVRCFSAKSREEAGTRASGPVWTPAARGWTKWAKLATSSYQNHHKPMVWLFPTTPAIEGLCCLCLSHAVPFPFAWLAPVLPLDLTLRVTSLDRPSQTNYHKYAYYLLLVPASFSSKHLSQVS